MHIFWCRHRMAIAISSVLGLLAGCQPANNQVSTASSAADSSTLSLEVVALKEKITKLEADNAELRNTPVILFGELDAAATAGDETKALAALERLKTKYPSSSESAVGAKRVATMVADREKKERESNRIASLGLKALVVNPKFTSDDVTVSVERPRTQKKWVFDAYDSQYRFKEAEKGSSFVTAKISIFSKSKDPRLPGIGVYVSDGAKIKKIGTIEYRFARWDDFGSYLGNNADYRNDFAHSTNIPFSTGVELVDSQIKKPLYLVATKEGCNTRGEERFRQPPVWYFASGCATLKDELAIDDFKNEALGIVGIVSEFGK